MYEIHSEEPLHFEEGDPVHISCPRSRQFKPRNSNGIILAKWTVENEMVINLKTVGNLRLPIQEKEDVTYYEILLQTGEKYKFSSRESKIYGVKVTKLIPHPQEKIPSECCHS